MENALTISVSPLQAILAFAFQVWLIVFPIIIIRKLNHLTELLEGGYDEPTDEERE